MFLLKNGNDIRLQNLTYIHVCNPKLWIEVGYVILSENIIDRTFFSIFGYKLIQKV